MHTSLPPEEQMVREYNGGFYTPYYGYRNLRWWTIRRHCLRQLPRCRRRPQRGAQHRANLPDEASIMVQSGANTTASTVPAFSSSR